MNAPQTEVKLRTEVDIDPRSIDTWPIRLYTDAGPVYLTIAEAEVLVSQLGVALRELDNQQRKAA